MEKGRLLLIPVPLGDGPIENSLVPGLREAIAEMREFIVENERTARRFLKAMGIRTPISDLQLSVYGKHTTSEKHTHSRKYAHARKHAAARKHAHADKHAVAGEYTAGLSIDEYLKPALAGRDVGLLSDAGCPAVADPGAAIVRRAHEKGIQVVPFVGPSSLLLALMASGFNGQQFTFHGYLPIHRAERVRKIQELERDSRKLRQTQLFIETPFRNNQLLEDLLSTCHDVTSLSVSCDLTTASEFIATRTMAGWKKQPLPDLHKRPAVFVLYAGE